MTDQLAVDASDDALAREATDDLAASPGSTAPDGTSADESAAASAWSRWRERRRNRVSKWDRPPDPRDWRFFVGTLGKVLIATGILMFGFVAYQLWGTGIETARAQNKLENQFEQLLADFGEPATVADAADRPDPPATGDAADDATSIDDAGAGTATIDDSPTGATDDATSIDDPADSASGADQTTSDADVAAVMPVAVDLSEEAVEQELPPIVRGDVLARLEIPAIGQTEYIVPGVALNDLKSGPGHYPDTPLPGQLGNSAIAGHRTTYGGPFFDVDQLRVADELIVTMANGDRFVYEVTGVEVVSASDYWVVTTTNPNIAELTLTSCHPKYTARDRIVVHSVLNPAKSSNVGIPTFYELEPDPDDAPIPGDDPVLQADAGTADATDAGEDDSSDNRGDDAASGATSAEPDVVDDSAGDVTGDDAAADDDLARPVTDDAATENDADGADGDHDDDDDDAGAGTIDDRSGAPLRSQPTGQVEDAFGQGWFHDSAAWPQIALWGFALSLISIGAYLVSRRFRHDSIGFMTGIVPFLVCLYFFFQNVNRLLPPGL